MNRDQRETALRWTALAGLASCLVLLALCGAPADAWARVGGGDSYGGFSTGGGGGGGGGGGDADLIFLLVWLIIEHPVIGIPVTLVVIAVGVARAYLKRKQEAGPYRPQRYRIDGRRRTRAMDLGALHAADPNFSVPAFLDFAQVVYTRCQQDRAGGRLERVAAYLGPQARQSLARRSQASAVHSVIIGATKLTRGHATSQLVEVVVDFEANLTEERGGRTVQLLVAERWSFQKRAGVLSPEPGKLVALVCPSCGNPSETRPDGRCVHCDTPIGQGQVLWQVAICAVVQEEPIKPPPLAPFTGVEAGTTLPTVYDPALGAMLRAFRTRYPTFDILAFKVQVREVFLALQQAWSERRWELARPHQTDHIFQTHRYWMERYARFGLTNRLEQVEVLDVDLAKLQSDAFYEAATVRIKARMVDYTVDANGQVVAGDRTRARTFSEYWTFIRTAGKPSARRKDALHCPSCGAPLDRISETGVCGYCGAKLATGSHDWVLSAIEQDEAYEG